MIIQTINLRPLSAGEILDRAFRLYRANFWLFISISGVLLGPLLVLQLLSQFIFQDVTIVAFIQGIATANLLPGALAYAASSVYLGHPISLNDSYLAAQRRFGSFFRANFTQGLAYIPAGLVIGVGAMGGTAGVILTSFFAIPYVVFLATRWGLHVPAIAIESLGASRGLERSWLLTSKDARHVFGTFLTSGLLVYLIGALPGVVVDYATTELESMREIGPSLSLVITQLGSLISTPLSVIAAVILYYDLRVRREGYDLELAMQTTTEEPGISDEQP